MHVGLAIMIKIQRLPTDISGQASIVLPQSHQYLVSDIDIGWVSDFDFDKWFCRLDSFAEV